MQFDLHLTGDFIHPPEIRRGEKDRPIIGALGRPQNRDHCQRIRGHPLSLVKLIADPQVRPAHWATPWVALDDKRVWNFKDGKES